MSNRLILSFLGMLNTSRFDVTSTTQGSASRNIIHLSKLRTEAKYGDIILFKCANKISHLQRAVTRSEFDHVGIVVRSQKTPGQLDILESTGDGVTCFSLTGRLKAYHHHNFVEYMCIRQLKDFDRTSGVLTRALDDFVEHVVGLPYGFSAAQVFSTKHKSVSLSKKLKTMMNTRKAETAYRNSLQTAEDSSKGKVKVKSEETSKQAFFCSELVAAVLKELDVIPVALNSEYFWPGCFSQHDEIDTIMKENNLSSFFGDELVIDCRVVEISKAVVSPLAIQKKKAAETLDKDIIVSTTSNFDTLTQPRVKAGEKHNSKNELNLGLEHSEAPAGMSELRAQSAAKLDVSCSDDDDDDDDKEGEKDEEEEEEEMIAAPTTTFAPSLF
jgi:hypothetical protein